VQETRSHATVEPCFRRITHKTGDIRAEVFGTSHWWKNLGKETVILYVGDVRKDPNDHNM
jgi:quercetin dioxygenase-like cupin family protein